MSNTERASGEFSAGVQEQHIRRRLPLERAHDRSRHPRTRINRSMRSDSEACNGHEDSSSRREIPSDRRNLARMCTRTRTGIQRVVGFKATEGRVPLAATCDLSGIPACYCRRARSGLALTYAGHERTMLRKTWLSD